MVYPSVHSHIDFKLYYYFLRGVGGDLVTLAALCSILSVHSHKDFKLFVGGDSLVTLAALIWSIPCLHPRVF